MTPFWEVASKLRDDAAVHGATITPAAAGAITVLMERSVGDERRNWRDLEIIALAKTIAPGATVRTAGSAILAELARYQRAAWLADKLAGHYAGSDERRRAMFAVMVLGGPPKFRALRTILNRGQSCPSKLPSLAA